MILPPSKQPNAKRRDPVYVREKTRKWREANPEKAKRQRARNYASRAERYRANPAYYLWRTARSRAKQVGLEFTIDVADVEVPTHCVITGLAIDVLTSNYQTGASLDRVDNSIGYVKGNVRVISRKANRIKSDLDEPTLLKLIAYIRGEL